MRYSIIVLMILGLVLTGCTQLVGTDPTELPAGIDEPSQGEEQSLPEDGPAPTPRPTPRPTPEAEPTPEPEKEGVYEVTASLLNFRSSPEVGDNTLGILQKGMRVLVTGEADGGFYHVTAPDGREGYCAGDYLRVAADDEIPPAKPFAYIPPDTKVVMDSNGNEQKLIDNLVDLRRVDDSILIYQIFATDENFTGQQLYSKSVCLIQEGTAQKLKKAQEMFQRDGYTILVYDAYRPFHVQRILYDRINNPRYIAKPTNGSNHNRGAAVDITLVDANGDELEMPSPMHTFNPSAHRDSPTMSAEAKKNMNYMSDIMKKCGFTVYRYEWWHFNDPDARKYMVTDHNLSQVSMIYQYLSTDEKPTD